VMITKTGLVKLMDFGIASDPSFPGDLTEAGTGLGTPSYMSPEQILGDRLDFRSDLFSLGIVLYQMVGGRKPFIEDAEKYGDDRRTLVEAVAAKRVLAFQISQLMAEQHLTKAEMARRMSTSRAAVDRLLDFDTESATVATLEKAAAALGRRLYIALV